MPRRFLLAPALFAAVPLHAQDAPAWAGVWEGKVGNLPVRACLDAYAADGPGHGSYYYLSRLEPIALREDGTEGGWTERAPDGETEALWEMDDFDGQGIRGTWHQPPRSLPIALHPVVWTEGEWAGPCGSEAFLGPRVSGGKVVSEAAELGGWAYTKQTYRPAAHFDEDVAVETFTFEPRQPGDAAIVAALAAHLPREAFEDDFVQCLGGSISSLGTDGLFDETLRPAFVSTAFLAVEESSSTFCGGAHPNYWTVTRTWDRRTGEEVDLFDWLGMPRIDGEDSTLSDDLRALVLARWPNAEAECRGYVAAIEYWSLGLARAGLVFRPDFPHALTPCEEPVTVEWDALEPFLDAEGRAGLARLREG